MTDARIITGNQAAALAARLCDVQVIAAYPITPQSQLAEMLSLYVESGQLRAEYVRVESEHSAHDGLHLGLHRRGAGLHRHQRKRPAVHARAAALGGGIEAPHRHVLRQPRRGRPLVHFQRPAGLARPARHGMGPDVLPRQPGDPRYGDPGLQDRRDGLCARHGLLRRLCALPHDDARRHAFPGGGEEVSAALQAPHDP